MESRRIRMRPCPASPGLLLPVRPGPWPKGAGPPVQETPFGQSQTHNPPPPKRYCAANLHPFCGGCNSYSRPKRLGPDRPTGQWNLPHPSPDWLPPPPPHRLAGAKPRYDWQAVCISMGSLRKFEPRYPYIPKKEQHLVCHNQSMA